MQHMVEGHLIQEVIDDKMITFTQTLAVIDHSLT